MICHSSNPKSSLLTCVMAVHSTNHALTAVIMILKDRNSLLIKIKSYVRTATRTTLKVEANLTQILNFKANFHTEFELFFQRKNYANNVDGRQCGNNLALCNFAVVMELPDSLYMNWKSEFGVIFLSCSPR